MHDEQPDPYISTRTSRLSLLCLACIVLIGAALRIAPLGREALGGDELFSRRVAMMPVHQAYIAIRDDLVHPPLYYYVLKADIAVVGASATGIRVVSLLFGILSIGLMGYLGMKLPGARYTGLVAAAIMAVNQYELFYSQEARSYAFYTFLVLLLVWWVDAIARQQNNTGLWALGLLLATAVTFTHYVGAVYGLSIVLTLLLCNLARSSKLRAVIVAVLVGVFFAPWLMAVAGVYRNKHGVGENLDWQGHPGLYDLKFLWANALGVMEFSGATTLVILLILLLAAAAFVSVSRRETLRRSPMVMALFLLSFLPPIAIFVLSNKPFNLPLFGLRHLLPSVALLGLLCAYGLDRLTERFVRAGRKIFAACAVLLLAFAAIPTLQELKAGPTRFPYDAVEKKVVAEEQSGEQAYAAWQYGEGEPVNFYCGHACVSALPENPSGLGDRLILLYRPHASTEAVQHQRLLDSGYVDASQAYYTVGLGSEFGTNVTEMVKAAH